MKPHQQFIGIDFGRKDGDLTAELRGYRYPDGKIEIVAGRYHRETSDHAADAMRYAMMAFGVKKKRTWWDRIESVVDWMTYSRYPWTALFAGCLISSVISIFLYSLSQ